MKIGQPLDLPVVLKLPTDSGRTAPGAQAKAESNANVVGVAVTVSKEARAMKQVSENNAPDIDMDKVNAVRTAIEQGTYVVNPQAIADKLLNNAQEMLKGSAH